MKVKRKGNVIKAKANYGSGEKVWLKLTDTGNGYIAKFPSHSSCRQDNIICLDYDEAQYLFHALNSIEELKSTEDEVI